MLLVNASKGASQIHGAGLIAREFISQDMRIWEYDQDVDSCWTHSAFAMIPSKWAALQVKGYSFFDTKRGCWICCGDDARFTNHSDQPNTWMDDWITYAAKDIFPGDEITEDYRLLGVELPK